MREHLAKAVIAVIVAALIAGGVWAWTSAPCGMYKFSKATDVPARCVLNK
jgi:hypothetical protein